MALTKEQKQEIVSELSKLLDSSKMTVVANYQGTTVKELQQLRRQAKEDSTGIKVVKNRLIIKALQATDALKDVDTSKLTSQLIYAFNSEDEVAPAQVLANFAKKSGKMQFVGAISQDGVFVEADDVKALASLPSKDQLRAQLVGTISAPLSGFVNVISGNVRGVMNVLNARAESIS